MHQAQLAKKDMDAQKRIITAAELLAERFGLKTVVRARQTQKAPRLVAMHQRQEIADLLEELVAETEYSEVVGEPIEGAPLISLEELAEVPGVGKATVDKVRVYLDARSAEWAESDIEPEAEPETEENV